MMAFHAILRLREKELRGGHVNVFAIDRSALMSKRQGECPVTDLIDSSGYPVGKFTDLRERVGRENTVGRGASTGDMR